jgi:hypothetical protein
MQHTKEPWEIEIYDSLNACVDGSTQGPCVSIVDKTGNMIADCGPENEKSHTNAQRIIDCVNGCAGIENPGAIGEVMEALKDAEKALERLEAFSLITSPYQWLEKRIDDALNHIEGIKS